MGIYVKRREHIQAKQWTGRNFNAIAEFTGEEKVEYIDHYRFILRGSRGNNVVETTDWVVMDVTGELYSCTDKVFSLTFARVSSE